MNNLLLVRIGRQLPPSEALTYMEQNTPRQIATVSGVVRGQSQEFSLLSTCRMPVALPSVETGEF